MNIDTDYYYQTPFIAKYLRNYLCEEGRKQKIIDTNKFKDRYNNNNDVFIHTRIINSKPYLPQYDYIEKILKDLSYDNIYLASDDPSDPICVNYINKYGMKVLDMDEIETIQFGTTCKHIVLSVGTFSWIIGVLGFFSDIYHADLSLNHLSHGDIFVFDDWKVIGP